jgi:uncharacterized protein with HEPN domain
MKGDIRDFLNDILRYSKAARALVENNGIEVLTEQYSAPGLAVERCIEIIGEAVKQIPDELRAQQPQIPWKQIAGLRDILIHRYWTAQVTRLIDIVENYLPDLEEAVEKMLNEFNIEN